MVFQALCWPKCDTAARSGAAKKEREGCQVPAAAGPAGLSTPACLQHAPGLSLAKPAKFIVTVNELSKLPENVSVSQGEEHTA